MRRTYINKRIYEIYTHSNIVLFCPVLATSTSSRAIFPRHFRAPYPQQTIVSSTSSPAPTALKEELPRHRDKYKKRSKKQHCENFLPGTQQYTYLGLNSLSHGLSACVEPDREIKNARVRLSGSLWTACSQFSCPKLF